MAGCTHLDQIADVTPSVEYACEDCVAIGDTWVHLRMCRSCGHAGCCDSSRNRHARRHFEDHGHGLVKSMEPGEHWTYCFVDDVAFELD